MINDALIKKTVLISEYRSKSEVRLKIHTLFEHYSMF